MIDENDTQTEDSDGLSSFTREAFEGLASGRFGPAWKLKTADFLGINRRTLQRWIKKGEFPQWSVDRLSEDLVADVIEAAQGASHILRAFDLGENAEGVVIVHPDKFGPLRALVEAVDRYREGSGRAR